MGLATASMRYQLTLLLLLATPVAAAGQAPPETFDACPTAIQDTLRAARGEFELTGLSFATSSGGTLTARAPSALPTRRPAGRCCRRR